LQAELESRTVHKHSTHLICDLVWKLSSSAIRDTIWPTFGLYPEIGQLRPGIALAQNEGIVHTMNFIVRVIENIVALQATYGGSDA